MRTKVICVNKCFVYKSDLHIAFLYLQFVFVFFLQKEIGKKLL